MLNNSNLNVCRFHFINVEKHIPVRVFAVLEHERTQQLMEIYQPTLIRNAFTVIIFFKYRV